MSCSKAKDIIWKASVCADRRSPPDSVPWGRWRDSLNVIVDDETALRRGGWARWGAEFDEIPNPDLHGTKVTTLFSWSQEWGNRILLAGSEGGVHRWSPGSGVWTALTGVPALESGERRSFAAIGDVCIFAGGLGGEAAESIRSYTIGDAGVSPIADLTTIGLTAANLAIEWRGVIFLMDVVMDGLRVGHRVVWSDFNDPLSYDPAIDSIAGQQDLDPGEFILGAGVSGDSLYLFTDRSIWRVVATGDDEVYRFQQTFKHPSGLRCLHAPYTLAILPDSNFIYMSNGGRVMIYSPYAAAPEEPEWLAVGVPDLGKNTDCRLFSGSVCDNGTSLEYLISFPAASADTEPTSTYAVDFDRLCVSRIDHGFWTMATWYNIAQECPRPTQVILSSAGDDSLKEARWFDVFTRERWDSEEEEWVLDEYESNFWSSALGFDLPGKDKRMAKLDVLAHTPADQTPGSIRVYVGHSNYPAEPATHFESCPIAWYTLSSKVVPCAAATSVPVPWRFLVEGRYLYYRIAMTGAAVAVSQIHANVEAI